MEEQKMKFELIVAIMDMKEKT